MAESFAKWISSRSLHLIPNLRRQRMETGDADSRINKEQVHEMLNQYFDLEFVSTFMEERNTSATLTPPPRSWKEFAQNCQNHGGDNSVIKMFRAFFCS